MSDLYSHEPAIEPIVEICPQMETSQARFVGAIDDYSQRLTDNHIRRVERASILQRIVPNHYRKLIEKNELMLIQQEFDFRKKALAIAKETQIQALRETCNQYLIQGKGDSREKITIYLMSKLQELENKLEVLDDEFNELIEKKNNKLKAITIPKLRRAKEQDLDRTIDRFVSLKEKALSSFQAIISESLRIG